MMGDRLKRRLTANGIVDVLGLGVHPVSMETAVKCVLAWAQERPSRPRYVCFTEMHGVMEARKRESFKRIHNSADLNVPDGMPLVWLGRLAGFSTIGRVFGPDLMLKVCEASAQSGLKHFFYGGKEGVARELAERLKMNYPGLNIVGTYTPPFRSLTDQEKEEVATIIDEKSPDFLWVGLSTPKQEEWMADILPRLRGGVLFGVGAAFDYNTGRIRRAPRTIQNLGLEWLFRVLQEPRRLARRYIFNVPAFAFLVALQIIGLRSAFHDPGTTSRHPFEEG
jgi:N-acetylglucosaminyldiphosphoundecaprenol N-acetyl-beta-D-mannosaminyltransferase